MIQQVLTNFMPHVDAVLTRANINVATENASQNLSHGMTLNLALISAIAYIVGTARDLGIGGRYIKVGSACHPGVIHPKVKMVNANDALNVKYDGLYDPQL